MPQRPSTQASAADAWGALLRVHATLVPMLDRELQAAHRLPLAWYDVLLELNCRAGPAAADERTGRAGHAEPDPGEPAGRRDGRPPDWSPARPTRTIGGPPTPC